MSRHTVHYSAIDERRSEMGVTKAAMAKMLGLSWEGLNAKLEGWSEFSFTEVLTIADTWCLGLDELVGRTVPSCQVIGLCAKS